jgi:hypothetical protein
MASKASPAHQGFPRVYRVAERTRHAVNFLLVAIGALFLSLTVLYMAEILPHRGSLGGLLWIDLLVVGLVLLLGSGYNKRAILHEDSIEVAGCFYSRKLNFTDIRGRQTTANSRLPGYAYMLVPSDHSKRTLVLPRYLDTDQFFRDWIKTIPKVPR